MELSRERYAQILDEYGLWGTPRRVGTPYSFTVGTPKAFFRWWDQTKDEGLPMFVAHSGYASQPPGQPVDPNLLLFRSAFGDFDTGDNNGCTPNEVMEETVKVETYLNDHHLPWEYKYSGSLGGSHLHVEFKPEVRRRDDLAELESMFWHGLANELNLRAINIRCANPVCMERLPFSRYSTKKESKEQGFKPKDNYCVPVPWEMAMRGDLKELENLSYNPEVFPSYRHPGKAISIEEFVRIHDFKRFLPSDVPVRDGPVDLPEGPVRDLIKLYIPYKLCLQELIFERKPKHLVRLGWIAEVFRLKPRPTLAEAIALTDKVAEEAQWVDRHNVLIRAGQVEQAWRANGGKGYTPPACDTIRKEKQCLGSRCPLFARMFPGEAEKEAKK